ncbi:MAG: NAD(P)/FAD-dependent oxidoreductase [Proteobacteria bacterium]|nr:NAD(P)/FAD-dependent oxidoreductase [Pseudomonadota bacterium]
MTERVECVVIGGGVVGLAVAVSLAGRGRAVLVLEAAGAVGTGVSARNSGVIHAGIYYPQGTLKARLCVAGRERLYRFCDTHGVEVGRCGKLIVATSEAQVARLAALQRAGHANGVGDLRLRDRGGALALEPDLHCMAALWSPATGILDTAAYLLALQGELERAGGHIALDAPVVSGDCGQGGPIRLKVGHDSAYDIEARVVINSAGLGAQRLARALRGLDPGSIPPLHYAKGNYYGVDGRVPFRHLIYPIPEDAGLGVHLTLDLGGRARFGPDVEWVNSIDYQVDPSGSGRFYAAIRRYWPGLRDGSLRPDYAGIRPKLSGPGEEAQDFMIQGPGDHGIGGLVNLYGIESPGLTASLAIGDYVADLVE